MIMILGKYIFLRVFIFWRYIWNIYWGKDIMFDFCFKLIWGWGKRVKDFWSSFVIIVEVSGEWGVGRAFIILLRFCVLLKMFCNKKIIEKKVI